MTRRPPRPATSRLRFALVITALCQGACGDQSAVVPGAEEPAVVESSATSREVNLYFPGTDGRLHAEARTLPVATSAEQAVSALLEALFLGPQTDGLWQPLPLAMPAVERGGTDDADVADAIAPPAAKPPPGTVRIGSIDLLTGGTVVVDLETLEPPAIGSREEQLILFSIVNTVLLNTPDVERLLFLWNGTQPYTFAGHLDTGHALVADRSLIGKPAT